ncbi:MAG: hypothetical protein NC433_08930 [Clostridiales bacterium]|nr:hypothetical protein [Clostridiales bacterium]
MIIAAYAGVGKTEFCKRNQEKAIDLVCMPFKYENFYEVSNELGEGEDIKAHGNLVLRKQWELFYYWIVKYLEHYCPEKYIVIPTVFRIMDLLESDMIPFTVVYPDISLKEEYEKRYKERGNSESFLDVFVGGWDSMLSGLEKYGKKNIVLSAGQFLADVIPCDASAEYIHRQLVSFEKSLLWENPRNAALRKMQSAERERQAKEYYMELTMRNSICRRNRTLDELRFLLSHDKDKKDEAVINVITDRESIYKLINAVIEEVNLHYEEYSVSGRHLRFTDEISLSALHMDTQLSRCMSPYNYLDVMYNPCFFGHSFEQINSCSEDMIKNKYLKQYLPCIIGILRQGNEYWETVVSEQITDEELEKMICHVYRQRLKEAYMYRKGQSSNDEICGVLCFEPICKDDVITDFTYVGSKKDLKLLLSMEENEDLKKIKLYILSYVNVDGKWCYTEKIYGKKELEIIREWI